MKRLVKIVIVAAVLLAVAVSSFSASAVSYNYNYEKIAVESPDVATVKYQIKGAGFKGASDIAVDSRGILYVADTENNRIAVFENGNVASRYITEVSSEPLNAPEGIFVDANDLLYISDTANGRVTVCTKSGELIRHIVATPQDVFNEEFIFAPQKACADAQGNTFVISKDAFDGLLQFDKNGKFTGFVGANKVSVSLWDRFWKNFSTKAQREKLKKDLPTEFDGLDIDSDGFVYTVTSTVNTTNPTGDDPVRMQTALGVNILKDSTITGKPIGDIKFPYWSKVATLQGASAFVDVSVCDYGYLCLDSKRGRVFAYNTGGDIMFILGGYGAKIGSFTAACAIETFGDNIYVLDKTTQSITVFELADYGRYIIEAQQQYVDGKYEESEKSWQQVLTLNSNSSLAYVGLGKVYLMQGRYKEAMEYLKLGGDRQFYSKAKGYLNQQRVADNLLYIIIVIAVLIIAVILYFKFLKDRWSLGKYLDKYEWYRGLKYGFYIMIHPFDGYWDMTHEKKGCMKSGIIIYLSYVFACVLEGQFTGFLHRASDEFNLLKTIGFAVIPIVLWCLCNWSVSTLLDGEGKPSAIILSTAYAILPYTVVKLVCIALSNVVTLEQAMFITLPTAFALVWTAFLLFSSVVTIHGYSAKQAVGTIILTIFAMAIVLFLAVLVINLVQQMAYFIVSIYNQLVIME